MDGQKEDRRQRAIDLAQAFISLTMLYFGWFDTQADQPIWLLGTVGLLGLTVFELDSRVYRLVESLAILAIPLSYALMGGVNMAYTLTVLLMLWNGLDFLVASLTLASKGKKAAIGFMERLG